MPRRASDHAPSAKVVRTTIAQYVRQKTSSGEELVELLLKIMRGKYLGFTKLTTAERTKFVLDATQMLFDRGFGKSPQPVDLDVDMPHVSRDPSLQEWSTEDLERLHEEIQQKAIGVGADVSPIPQVSFEVRKTS